MINHTKTLPVHSLTLSIKVKIDFSICLPFNSEKFEWGKAHHSMMHDAPMSNFEKSKALNYNPEACVILFNSHFIQFRKDLIHI